jgi:probable rRNA maturation factor
MIIIKNTQTDVVLDETTIKNQLETICKLINYEDFSLNVWFATSDEIQKLNKQFRHKDTVTDIISFPYHEDAKPDIKLVVRYDEDKHLGDIIICPQHVIQDVPRYEQTFAERLRDLLVHGTLHLIGYDHISDDDYAVMNKKEFEIITQL